VLPIPYSLGGKHSLYAIEAAGQVFASLALQDLHKLKT
jgi:hypothetical protein